MSNNNHQCDAAQSYASIQQAYKKNPGEERKPVSFTTPIQAVYDGKTGASLEAILAQFNSIYVQYQGSPQATRLIIPKEMRRAGLTITYMDMDSNTITERANSAVQKNNDHWALDVNWSRVDELSLSGDISVSAAGTWIINGQDTGVKALGPKGDTGLTPWLKTIDNRLHFSYDNETWEPCSENIAAWFRWSGNKIQISRDNKTWTDLSGKFADNIHIKGYVASTAALPSGASQGDIYGVGPTYAAEDTAHTNPIYRYYVRNANAWVDNGSFTSISAGVVQKTGYSETEVMSQKAVTEKLSELESEIDELMFNEESISPLYSKACAMVLGESPLVEDKSAYKCFRISVKNGDKVSVIAKSGSSLPTYGLVKDNVFTFVSSVGLSVEQTFDCDGTFDEIIVNNYTGYISDPTVVRYNKNKKITESLSEVYGAIESVKSDIASGKNIVHYYEEGYVSFDNTIVRGGGERFKFVMIPVYEGEKYAYYSKYSASLYVAFCADKKTWFDRKNVVQGWNEITIPSGCNYLAVSIQFYDTDHDAVNNAFLYNTKILEKTYTEISKLSNDLSELMFSEQAVSPLYSKACAMVLGESPLVEDKSAYRCFRTSVNEGDRISIEARSGESLPTYGLVKDNVFTFVSSVGLSVEQTFDCDGTFDEIIVNNYSGYVSDPKVVKYVRRSNQGGSQEMKNREVNVLMLGNSFTQDAMSYVPFIMQDIAPNLKLNIAIGYIGGCSLAQHCANLLEENQVLNDNIYSPASYTYQLCESGDDAWRTIGNKTIDEMLVEKKWDIITLQQNGGNAAGSWDKYYAPFIYKIHKAIYQKIGHAVKLGWLLVHGAYASTAEELQSNWNGSAENSRKIQEFTPNQLVFPYGTAVQNLRTTPLADLGDGGFLMGDMAHLHEGIGCLTAAYANVLTIIDALGLGELSVIGEKTRPTKAWCNAHGVLAPNYGETTNDVVGITEENCYLAQVAAIQAVKKPYEVTDCSNFPL